MRLLIDANLSPRIATYLRSVGYDAVHVRDEHLVTASDREISEFARSGNGFAHSGNRPSLCLEPRRVWADTPAPAQVCRYP